MRSMYFSNGTIDGFLTTATAGQVSAVRGLIASELELRDRRKRERLVRKARFPQVKSFEGYDFSQVALPEGYGVDDLRSLGFVEHAEDFVFHGQTGRGKTHLAIAMGMAVSATVKTTNFAIAH